MHKIPTAILAPLHLRVDDTAVFTLAVDVVHLGNEAGLGHGGVKDVVEVDGDLG